MKVAHDAGVAAGEPAVEPATVIDRASDMATALATLARIAAEAGDIAARTAHLDRIGELMLTGISECALRAAERALVAPGEKKKRNEVVDSGMKEAS